MTLKRQMLTRSDVTVRRVHFRFWNLKLFISDPKKKIKSLSLVLFTQLILLVTDFSQLVVG